MSYSDDTIEWVMGYQKSQPIRRSKSNPDNVFTHNFDPQTETCVCGVKPWQTGALRECEWKGRQGGGTSPSAVHEGGP